MTDLQPRENPVDPSHSVEVFRSMAPQVACPLLDGLRWPGITIASMLPRGESTGPSARALAQAW